MADAWCAAFVIKKYFQEPGREASVYGITSGLLNDLANGQPLPAEIASEVERLIDQYQFFHWHLAFPEVFAQEGFDCVLGNPPWERVKLQEKEWFAERCPEIANATNAASRKRLIEALQREDPLLYKAWLAALRKSDGESHLFRNSGRYPLCGRGDINVYTIFAEGMRALLASTGAMGAILPSGLATDDTTKHFFEELTTSNALWSFFEFENEGFFPGAGQGHMLRFALTTIRGKSRPAQAADFVFQAKAISDLKNAEQHFTLTAEDIALLNPNTRTCPIFCSRRDAEVTKAIYRRLPVLIREVQEGWPEQNLWGIKLSTMFHMSNDSHLFRTREQLQADGWRLEGNVFRKDADAYLPLYEAKMVHQFNHRHGDFGDSPGQRAHILPEIPLARLNRADYYPLPFYWVAESDVASVLAGLWNRRWLLGWRDVTDARASARTVVASVIPYAAVNDKFLLMMPSHKHSIVLPALLLSFAFDYAARQKVGGLALKFFTMRQLPTVVPERFSISSLWLPDEQSLHAWLLPRILELTYTCWDLEAFAEDCSWSSPPFRWDEDRRFLLRCELDAAFLHLYLLADESGQWKSARIAEGAVRDETPEELAELKRHFPTPRDAVAYIMDTFPIVRRKDEEKYNGDYRTKRVILEIYDAMQEAIRTGKPYQTILDPPPADPRCCHPPREAVAVPALAEVVPFRRVKPSRAEHYKTCVPLLSLKAAAGAFSGDQAVEFEDWVEVHPSHQLRKGMFVARVAGKSMEPLIPDGSHCLFRYPVFGTRQGKIVLVEYRGIDDPETGGSYTIKTYESEKVPDEDGGWKHSVIRLVPANPAYQPIVLKDVDEGAVRVIAEFVEVLKPYV